MYKPSTDLSACESETGSLAPVFRIAVQTRPDDIEKILNAAAAVNPLTYGKYDRNAFISGRGSETYRAQPGSTTTLYRGIVDQAEYFDCVEVSFSIPRDIAALTTVMDAIRNAHHYEEPVIFVSEHWASRANYNPDNQNPNRWWNTPTTERTT